MTKWMRGFCVVVASLTLMTDTAFAGGFVLEEHGYYIIDFLVLFGALYFLLRKPARQFLLDRHEAVAKEMEESSGFLTGMEKRLKRRSSHVLGEQYYSGLILEYPMKFYQPRRSVLQ